MIKILLPVDFSDSSINACEYTLSLTAKIPDARVLLLHCFYDYLAESDEALPADDETTASEVITERVLYRNQADAQEQLEQIYQTMLREIRAAGSAVHLEQAFISGLAEEKIAEEAQRFSPDLVIMGTRGESNMARSFFGTVTTQVIEDAHIPILTIPESYNGNAIHRVLYATNFDKADVKAITTLASLLEPFHPAILCVHVGDDEKDEDRQNLTQLQQQLQTTTSSGNIRYTLLEGDNVADALQNFAIQEKVDLLALTTHERGSWERLFNPSLTKKLVLHASTPLLIFHSSAENT